MSNTEEDAITFHTGGQEIVKFCGDGQIFIKGTLCENNKEVVAEVYAFFKLMRGEMWEEIHCNKCKHIRCSDHSSK